MVAFAKIFWLEGLLIQECWNPGVQKVIQSCQAVLSEEHVVQIHNLDKPEITPVACKVHPGSYAPREERKEKLDRLEKMQVISKREVNVHQYSNCTLVWQNYPDLWCESICQMTNRHDCVLCAEMEINLWTNNSHTLTFKDFWTGTRSPGKVLQKSRHSRLRAEI